MPPVTTTVTKPPARDARQGALALPSPELDAALADFRAHGDVARAMIARLGALLDRMDALPMGDAAGWATGQARYLGLRYGPLPRPLPPGAWPFPATLRDWQHRGWALAIRCRGTGMADADLWASCWPQAETDALDRRAGALCIDERARQAMERRKRR